MQNGYARIATRASDLARRLTEILKNAPESEATRDFVETIDGVKYHCVLKMSAVRE